MRCLFLAPLKSPDHPTPSGERTMARLFVKLLENIGYQVELASHLRSFVPDPDTADWHALREDAAAEIERLLAGATDRPAACVFTYHVYYKAPDLIGPALAARLGVPYVIAEPSRAPKRAVGRFAEGHALAEHAIDAARLLLTPTAADREMLDRLKPPGQLVADLKPFINLREWPDAPRRRVSAMGAPVRSVRPVRLVSVAMMRDGDKLASYRQLAAALEMLRVEDWTLDIVGDGPARGAVEAAFAPLGERVTFHGALTDRAALGACLSGSDIFVWPGVNEAFGVVYLEAQARGLACVAGAYGGISDTMQVGRTGLLTPTGDVPAFAEAVRGLIIDTRKRQLMGADAARFIAEERDLPVAAATLLRAFAEAGIALPETDH
ncbi:glycosyltransferase family 4 protein [Ancylobacter pratisalsi]|uniref:Glycosyltransferase family 4 protein n=1 Tax=Ancylobacter pratisalsi TaxID=1745854 RepID=A0A6P1YSE7_9HYPH|nr:glycosyltransferase family 4 protein [Ancylobacter pratisalsi]QIB35955.1 glycosyltransferase family 4 protein [Ancylobacter pratisalsi]